MCIWVFQIRMAQHRKPPSLERGPGPPVESRFALAQISRRSNGANNSVTRLPLGLQVSASSPPRRRLLFPHKVPLLLACFPTMKIEKANAGSLTNFEVLDFLRSRGATSDPMGCLGSVAPSECKVFEYLNGTPACTQTRESVNNFLVKADKFKITASEKLNIINLTPRGQPELYGMIKDCEKRLVKTEEQIVKGEKETVTVEDHAQEILELVEEMFPQPAEEEPQEETQEELPQ